jgi:hypothetical protein
VAGHIACRQEHDGLPTRVLNITRTNPFIQNSKSLQGRYVALSHRWGSKPTLTTTQATLKRWQEMIPVSEFPATFRDAILISKRVGVSYLWIDSLCIIQDSTEECVHYLAPDVHRIADQIFLKLALGIFKDAGLFSKRLCHDIGS